MSSELPSAPAIYICISSSVVHTYICSCTYVAVLLRHACVVHDTRGTDQDSTRANMHPRQKLQSKSAHLTCHTMHHAALTHGVVVVVTLARACMHESWESSKSRSILCTSFNSSSSRLMTIQYCCNRPSRDYDYSTKLASSRSVLSWDGRWHAEWCRGGSLHALSSMHVDIVRTCRQIN